MLLTVIACSAGMCLMPALQAAGGSPAERYQDALARERNLRQPGATPAVGELRELIAAYESIVRTFPASDYEDRALWQAAGLAVEAYDRYREDVDLEVGIRLLRRLARFHHGSPFAARVAERRGQLEALTRFARLTGVEREVWDDVVRVLIRLDRDVPFRSERLADPERLFFDFSHTGRAGRAARRRPDLRRRSPHRARDQAGPPSEPHHAGRDRHGGRRRLQHLHRVRTLSRRRRLPAPGAASGGHTRHAPASRRRPRW